MHKKDEQRKGRMQLPVCAFELALSSKLHEFVVRPCIDHPTLLYRELEEAEGEEDIERGGDNNILRRKGNIDGDGAERRDEDEKNMVQLSGLSRLSCIFQSNWAIRSSQ